MKFLSTTLITVATSGLLLLVFLASHIFHAPPQSPPVPVDVRVEQGESLAAVVRKLRERKVIINERLFSLWARFTGVEKRIHTGLYRFDYPMSPQAILDRLVTGKGIFHILTIPEGFTVKEIADLLEKMQIADGEKFLAEAANPELLNMLGLDDKGIEGYLFPNTYYFTPATSERDIIITMAEQFRKVFMPLLSRHEGVMQLSPHEIVTLASIIEKETGVEAERPLIAAVFHNRLKLRMPLQSDPTVIYGLKNFQGNLTRKNLQDPSPYNTYRIPALPPGPICNPGLSSIRAALQPAPIGFLYFVSKNDGTHQFSESLEAHNRAVKIFQPAYGSSSPRRKVVSNQR